MTTAISAALRRVVRARAASRCEYCLLAEDDAYFPHEPDHIIARKHGGVTDASNLALACFDCNRFKGTDIASVDLESRALTPLYNPRLDPWIAHFGATKGRIRSLTPVGRVTIAVLRINVPARVELRDELALLGRWPGPGP